MATAIAPTKRSEAALVATSGQAPVSVPARSRKMKNAPNETPAPRACGTPALLIELVIPSKLTSVSSSSGEAEETSTTETRATTTPVSAIHPGRSPVTRPNATGAAAATTPVIGATIVIRPTASPR